MTPPILVTGGRGTLGLVVVRQLTDARRPVRAVSRSTTPPVDLLTGDGLDTALAGVGTVIHCATTLGSKDVVATENLLTAARAAGVKHLVYISIVGIDRIPLPYYKTKLAVERLIEDSGIPWTTLRTTQFHDLLALLWSRQRLPVLFYPSLRFQPVDTESVAARLIDLADGPPAGRVPDLGGPKVEKAGDLARAYLRSTGSRRPAVPLWLPGKTFAAYRRGEHLTPDHAYGLVDFDTFLAR
ncbi:SDR family oxidoreductase [Actinokineospora xionganensis]|uniref:NmrA family NAD(P)-binding protein n=1 Tax=Actinokineospora xionganensis TaxID=2684470 RepID=A0ABR7L4K2_9PSEU|nr:NAD(P)H-binding protein [Actinokineospora xionganensis]MBC6447615.1 NmrA family NAD(P)-binding protein [Actinokineospora xionganensis]